MIDCAVSVAKAVRRASRRHRLHLSADQSGDRGRRLGGLFRRGHPVQHRHRRRPRRGSTSSRSRPAQPASSHGARTICDTPGARQRSAVGDLAALRSQRRAAARSRQARAIRIRCRRAVLFNSGQPMLMVPYIHTGPITLDRVLICWDGGRPAARAVHDAHAVPAQGQDDRHRRRQRGRGGVGQASSRRADRASAAPRPRRHRAPLHLRAPTNIHNTILSLAADISADLLVMGGYGHSRLREFILGGVTRGMFKSLTRAGADLALRRRLHCRRRTAERLTCVNRRSGVGHRLATSPRRTGEIHACASDHDPRRW